MTVLHQAKGWSTGESKCEFRGFAHSECSGFFTLTNHRVILSGDRTEHRQKHYLTFKDIFYLHTGFYNARIVHTIAFVEAFPDFLWSTSMEA